MSAVASSGLSPEQIFTLLGVLGPPISGIIIAIIANIWTKRIKPATAEPSTSTQEVALRTVKTGEREAHTHEIAVIIEGFTVSLENLRTDLGNTRLEHAETKAELSVTREEVKELRDQVETSHVQRSEMIRHIVALESLVPNPPGPPTRPVWEL